jgi:hypothetical protein
LRRIFSAQIDLISVFSYACFLKTERGFVMKTLLIPKNTTALLQSLRDLVGRGYHFWTSGTIKILKAESLCNKFNEQYGVLVTKQRRDYNRKLGRANVYLFMYPQPGGDLLDWILIATQGKGAIHMQEKLRDHTSGQHTDRVRWRHYEIVALSDRATWRLRREVAEDWEKKMVAAARKKNRFDLEQTQKVLCNFPMFTGVRQQVWKILQKTYRTRKRHHYSDEVSLSNLPIMRRIKTYDTPPKTLGQLVDEYQARLKDSVPLEAA